jgi:hypothetical protein
MLLLSNVYLTKEFSDIVVTLKFFNLASWNQTHHLSPGDRNRVHSLHFAQLKRPRG